MPQSNTGPWVYQLLPSVHTEHHLWANLILLTRWRLSPGLLLELVPTDSELDAIHFSHSKEGKTVGKKLEQYLGGGWDAGLPTLELYCVAFPMLENNIVIFMFNLLPKTL